MIFEDLNLMGAACITPEPNTDQRGFFARIFCDEQFLSRNMNTTWRQINNSLSNEVGTLRGLHLQMSPYSEVKLVRCISGRIWDVIVDLRSGSLTYSQWYGCELTAENRKMMYVPEGFAHGFITLAPDSEIIYFVSEPYRKSAERTIAWDDPEIGIKWPMQPKVISSKDKQGLNLNKFEEI